jgi:protocatechuate 3,4-dioxygenase beta subunit
MQATLPMDMRAYKFDIVLRGRRSTMFENRREGNCMAQKLDRLKESPSQTAGPYVHIGLTPNFADIGGVYPPISAPP